MRYVVVRVDVFSYSSILAATNRKFRVRSVWNTSRLVCDRQVGSQCIVNEAGILVVSRDDFLESCAPWLTIWPASLGATFFSLTSPELLLIFKTVWDFKFHATCSVMALSTKHGLRNYCHAAWPKVVMDIV
jgi:hypothetical protein